MARGSQVLPFHPDARAAWLSAGAGPQPLPQALPAPQPWAAGRTGRARPVATGVVGPESHRANSDKLWSVSQQGGSDAGGSSAAGLGKFGMVTNAATKGRVTLTPRPALTHAPVTPVPWVLLGRGLKRAVLQDVKSRVSGWLHGLPANLPFLLLLFLIQASPHFKVPQRVLLHPFSPTLFIRAASSSHTCTHRLAGPGGPRGHQPLRGCSMARIVLVQSRLFCPCAAIWSHLWAHSQSVRTSRSSMIHTEISTPAFSCRGFLVGHP